MGNLSFKSNSNQSIKNTLLKPNFKRNPEFAFTRIMAHVESTNTQNYTLPNFWKYLIAASSFCVFALIVFTFQKVFKNENNNRIIPNSLINTTASNIEEALEIRTYPSNLTQVSPQQLENTMTSAMVRTINPSEIQNVTTHEEGPYKNSLLNDLSKEFPRETQGLAEPDFLKEMDQFFDQQMSKFDLRMFRTSSSKINNYQTRQNSEKYYNDDLKLEDLLSINGHIIDQKTNLPVQGAEISLYSKEINDSFSSQSTDDGDFRFIVTKSGSYDLKISKDGYLSILKSNIDLTTLDNIFTYKLSPLPIDKIYSLSIRLVDSQRDWTSLKTCISSKTLPIKCIEGIFNPIFNIKASKEELTLDVFEGEKKLYEEKFYIENNSTKTIYLSNPDTAKLEPLNAEFHFVEASNENIYLLGEGFYQLSLSYKRENVAEAFSEVILDDAGNFDISLREGIFHLNLYKGFSYIFKINGIPGYNNFETIVTPTARNIIKVPPNPTVTSSFTLTYLSPNFKKLTITRLNKPPVEIENKSSACDGMELRCSFSGTTLQLTFSGTEGMYADFSVIYNNQEGRLSKGVFIKNEPEVIDLRRNGQIYEGHDE